MVPTQRQKCCSVLALNKNSFHFYFDAFLVKYEEKSNGSDIFFLSQPETNKHLLCSIMALLHETEKSYFLNISLNELFLAFHFFYLFYRLLAALSKNIKLMLRSIGSTVSWNRVKQSNDGGCASSRLSLFAINFTQMDKDS